VARFIHCRIYGLHPDKRLWLHARFHDMAHSRDWRDQRPWLADGESLDVFKQLYFAEAGDQAKGDAGEQPSAATFLRIAGDETDALALVFMMRELSERFGVRVAIRDPDNPIAKLRTVNLDAGRLPDGKPLEAIMVRRPIFKRLHGGQRIEMYPPQALVSAFGRVEGDNREPRSWSFRIHGMRDSRPSFLEAEAEAMRIWRGLRFLE
jgi:hypothetical protein